MHSLVTIIIALIVIGFLFWAIKQVIGLVPMDEWFKQIINVILMIVVVAIVIFYVIIPLLQMLPTSIHF